MPKFAPKNALFGNLWARNLKAIVKPETSTLELVLLQNFIKNQNCLNLEQEVLYLGIFDQKCLIWLLLGHNF